MSLSFFNSGMSTMAFDFFLAKYRLRLLQNLLPFGMGSLGLAKEVGTETISAITPNISAIVSRHMYLLGDFLINLAVTFIQAAVRLRFAIDRYTLARFAWVCAILVSS